MILAAGMGSRLRPVTDEMPKALVPINGKPMLAHVIERLKLFGCRDIVINIHHLGEQIISYLQSERNFGLNILVSDERNYLLDTGGGVKQASTLFAGAEPVLVHNVDIISNANLHAFYAAHRPDALASLFVSSRSTSRYLLFNQSGLLCGWRNKATGEIKSFYPDFDASASLEYAFGGIHLLSPRIFSLMDEWTGKFSIINFYLSVCARHNIYAWQPDNAVLFDAGKPEGIAAAARWMKPN
jgi:NDP-sugar pyrophosphorylase family protein